MRMLVIFVLSCSFCVLIIKVGVLNLEMCMTDLVSFSPDA